MMFQKLDYKKWIIENQIHELFDVDINEYGEINSKIEKNIYETVDPENKIPFPPELDDLTRLHFIVRSRKVTTILEFGVGKSTLVFADALKKNKAEFGEFVNNNLRRGNAFEIYSIDNNKEWIEECKKTIPSTFLNYLHFLLEMILNL